MKEGVLEPDSALFIRDAGVIEAWRRLVAHPGTDRRINTDHFDGPLTLRSWTSMLYTSSLLWTSSRRSCSNRVRSSVSWTTPQWRYDGCASQCTTTKSTMDPRLLLRLPLHQTSSGAQYFVDGRSTMTASQLASSLQYYVPHHHHQHHQYHQQQQQRHWDAMFSVWNPQTVTSHGRKLFSVDAILNHSDTWRMDHELFSRLETSDLSRKLLQLLFLITDK